MNNPIKSGTANARGNRVSARHAKVTCYDSYVRFASVAYKQAEARDKADKALKRRIEKIQRDNMKSNRPKFKRTKQGKIEGHKFWSRVKQLLDQKVEYFEAVEMVKAMEAK